MWNFSVASTSDVVGIVGVFTYLGAYFALQTGFIRGQTYTYAMLNIIAAGCILFNLKQDFNMSSTLIQVSVIAISAVGIYRLYFISIYHNLNNEESNFISSKLPSLPKNLARKLLDRGFWVDMEPKTLLTKEGEPVRELIYLAEGEAVVSFGNQLIVRCNSDNFIGELTCMTAEPATATVTVTKPSRCFCIPTEALRQLGKTDSELRQALEVSFATDVRKKLIITNERQRHLASSDAGGHIVI